jgi:hypothetical protein
VKALLAIAIIFAATMCGAAFAQSGGGYDLHWNVVAAGAGAMNGAGYMLTGTLAQHTAAQACANGYALRSGFWVGVPEADVIFRNGFDAC